MDWLWNWDERTFRAIHLGWHQTWLDTFFGVVTAFGLDQVIIPILILFFSGLPKRIGLPRLAQSRETWFWPLFGCYAIPGLVNQAFKHLIVRDRPSNLAWAHPQEQVFHHSFTSGHTTVAFGVATGIFWLSRGSKQAWLGPLALVVAVLVGLSRVYRGVHWPTDVLGGAFVGMGLATLIVYVTVREPAQG